MKLHSSATYQPELAQRYARVATSLQLIIPFAKLEHIGSSSVPGAISKADLDVCMIVDGACLEQVVQTLKRHAYTEKMDTLRTGELCMLECQHAENEHAVQVVASGSQFEELFLVFRTLLRAKPELLAQYNHVKLNSVGLGSELYRQAKSEFICATLAAYRNTA
jgi:GrpB-like predicted nucleotidyltransferase (UPF0157 family)